MKKIVLLVDDNEIDNLIHERIISTLGLIDRVHVASNGQEALKVLNHYHQREEKIPNIIFLDLNMPVMDGFEFIKAFKVSNFPNKENTEIIILTSSFNQEDINKAKELGVKHYFTKPINVEQLKSVLVRENS